MKSIKNKTFKLDILVAIIIYILTAFLFTGAIVYLIYREHVDTLKDFAYIAAEDYASGTGFEAIDTHSFGLLVYDAQQHCIFASMPLLPRLENDAKAVYEPSTVPFVSDVLSGKTCESLIYAKDINLFAMFVAVPGFKDGKITNAFFLIRNIEAMWRSIIIFISAYSVAYILIASIFISFQRRRSRFIQMQQTYVANMNHDLKSPITSIRALSETMYEQLPANSDEKNYCGFIISESVKLEHSIQQILELSRLQTNNSMFEKSTVALSDLFEPVFSKYKLLCYDMMIDFSVPENLENLPKVRTNPDAINQVMDIILDNAIKFTDENSGKIMVDVSAENRYVLVSIRDNGIGMDKETQAHIFERFYMGDKSHNSKGSGLGLSIVQEILNGLNEKITVESIPEKGSIFAFTLHM